MKQTKITIILDQPLQGEHTETVTRAILGDRSAFGYYKTFSQDRVWIEEIDSEVIEKYTDIYKEFIEDIIINLFNDTYTQNEKVAVLSQLENEKEWRYSLFMKYHPQYYNSKEFEPFTLMNDLKLENLSYKNVTKRF